jgi:hypothetical protein
MGEQLIEVLIAGGLILISAILLFIFSFTKQKKALRRLRPIPAFQHLRRAVGLTVEAGKRIHISLGKGHLLDPTNPSAFIGLSTLERLTKISMVSDRPPIATSGESLLALLSRDTIRAAYREANILEQFDPERGRLTGPTSASYTTGTIPVIKQEEVMTNVLVGNFGPEVALICDAAEQQKSFTIAASDSLQAQAVLYATAKEPLIGEELFALPAYLQAGRAFAASLRVQDVLRWILIGGMIIGAVIKFLGPVLGL